MFARIMAEGFMTSLLTIITFVFYTIGIKYINEDTNVIMSYFIDVTL
jgi:hypothetical protein